MLLVTLVQALITPLGAQLLSVMSYDSLVTFVDLIQHLKPTIVRIQRLFHAAPPETLPANVHDFIAASLGISDEDVKRAWHVLRHIAWDHHSTKQSAHALMSLFLQHGISRGLGM